MGSKKPPEPPDYEAAAEKTAQSSRENTNTQSWANRPNQYTPYGNTTWETEAVRDPATGQRVTQWSQNTRLRPELERALQSQVNLTQGRSDIAGGMYDRMVNEFAPIVDFDGFDPMGEKVQAGNYDLGGLMPLGDPNQYRARAEDNLYRKASSRLDPRFAREAETIEAKLRNQGLRPGDEAWNEAMGSFNRNKNDAYDQAMFGSISGGLGEAQGMFGMNSAARGQQFSEMMGAGGQRFAEGMSASNYNTQRRQQQIAEEMQRRGFSLNEINALLTGQQVQMPNMPSFNTNQRSETTQYSQAAKDGYQSKLDSFNAEQQAMQGMISGIGSVAGSFMPM